MSKNNCTRLEAKIEQLNLWLRTLEGQIASLQEKKNRLPARIATYQKRLLAGPLKEGKSRRKTVQTVVERVGNSWLTKGGTVAASEAWTLYRGMKEKLARYLRYVPHHELHGAPRRRALLR